jgi:hypothetical protein
LIQRSFRMVLCYRAPGASGSWGSASASAAVKGFGDLMRRELACRLGPDARVDRRVLRRHGAVHQGRGELQCAGSCLDSHLVG